MSIRRMTETCIFPNCENTEGVPIPKNQNLCNKWLDLLGISDFLPTNSSFVCIDHVPKNVEIGDENYDKEEPTNDKPFKETCRLCLESNNLEIKLSDQFNEEVTIKTAIITCIPSIQLSEDSKLSNLICERCLISLRFFYKFRDKCLKSNTIPNNLANKKRKHSNSDELEPKRLQTEPKTDTTDVNDTKPKNDVDRKFELIEAELRRMIEGNLTEEMKTADNIIIQIESDHESDEKPSTPPQHSVKAIINDNKIIMGSNEVVLPKGIKIVKTDLKIGTYPAKTIISFYENEFCSVNKYLFQFRLNKGNKRHLSCILSNCHAVGEQKIFPGNVYDDNVTLKKAHNHLPPSDEEMKKQMFYFVMKRKMQSDRTLNFRSVYEDICSIDPELKELVPLKNVINEICCQQLTCKLPAINSFKRFFEMIEIDAFQRLHFTHNNKQFYQEKIVVEDGGQAIIFANCEILQQLLNCRLMYVDCSFKIDTQEDFKYHLLTILVWIEESYYPIIFGLINKKSLTTLRVIFNYIQGTLAPNLHPQEIITDYDSNLYYALKEVYVESYVGGSVFYYTQNLYKKICSLSLSKELETNSHFRHVYHMLLMLPLLPINTIVDALNNIISNANDSNLNDLTNPIIEHVRNEWINKVTPTLFSVHKCENRINENVIAPFKKLRDFLMLSKGKMQKHQITIVSVVEKLIELENFLQTTYSAPTKKTFARDLSCSQKKNVLRAWQFIENHPKININHFFTKVFGYVKCMENQLWIWGFYGYQGDADDDLIDGNDNTIFEIREGSEQEEQQHQQQAEFEEEEEEEEEEDQEVAVQNEFVDYYPVEDVVLDVVIDQNDGFLMKQETYVANEEIVQLQQGEIVEEVLEGGDEIPEDEEETHFQNVYLKYVNKK